jgi:hypothetical protein
MTASIEAGLQKAKAWSRIFVVLEAFCFNPLVLPFPSSPKIVANRLSRRPYPPETARR